MEIIETRSDNPRSYERDKDAPEVIATQDLLDGIEMVKDLFGKDYFENSAAER